MKNKNSSRFALTGPPGCGKSTFATKLSKLLSIPVHHLDTHMFEINGKKRDKEEFINIQKAILKEKSWIVEGCSFSTLEMRFSNADTLIYFQFSRFICFWRIFKRLFIYEKKFGGLRVFNWELLRYIWYFDKHKKSRIKELRNKYNELNFLIFKNQKDADTYLKSL